MDVIAQGKANRALQSRVLGIAASETTLPGITSLAAAAGLALTSRVKVARADRPVVVRALVPRLYNEVAGKLCHIQLRYFYLDATEAITGGVLLDEDEFTPAVGGTNDWLRFTLHRVMQLPVGEHLFALEGYTTSGGTLRFGTVSSTYPISLEVVGL